LSIINVYFFKFSTAEADASKAVASSYLKQQQKTCFSQ